MSSKHPDGLIPGSREAFAQYLMISEMWLRDANIINLSGRDLMMASRKADHIERVLGAICIEQDDLIMVEIARVSVDTIRALRTMRRVMSPAAVTACRRQAAEIGELVISMYPSLEEIRREAK